MRPLSDQRRERAKYKDCASRSRNGPFEVPCKSVWAEPPVSR